MLSSYLFVFIVQRLDGTRAVREFRAGKNGVNQPREQIRTARHTARHLPDTALIMSGNAGSFHPETLLFPDGNCRFSIRKRAIFTFGKEVKQL
jgi:hypothetical protein